MESIKRKKMKKFYKVAMPKAKCDWEKNIHKYLTVKEIEKLLLLTKKYNVALAFEKKSMLVENSQITFIVTPKIQNDEHIWYIKEAMTIEYDDIIKINLYNSEKLKSSFSETWINWQVKYNEYTQIHSRKTI